MKGNFIELIEILKDPDLYCAHSKETQEQGMVQYETLEEHTRTCQQYFKEICQKKQIEEKMEQFFKVYMGEISIEARQLFHDMWRNVVTFHDVGKINPHFQRNVLLRKEVERNGNFNPVGSKHSSLSAVLYFSYYLKKIEKLNYEEGERLLNIMLCNGYIISRHHSRLVSMESFLSGFCDGDMKAATKVLEKEYCNTCQGEFYLSEKFFTGAASIFKERKQTKKQSIWLELYVKLVYSILVAADYYATSQYNSQVKTRELGELTDITKLYQVFQNTKINQSIRNYEKMIYPMEREKLQKVKEINILRKEIFLDAEKKLLQDRKKILYYVEAPTGGGKSNLAMNLSLQLAKEDRNLKKIYYVYPFNTLVEQNQEIMNRTFGNVPQIMDQIAVINSITPIKQVRKEREKEEKSECGDYYVRALLNRQFLNYPIILTTHVSLFDTLFGDSKESAFGFHQLSGSILVLDEIQSYKNKLWGEIITFLTEIAEFLHMKVIIMSATLPNLEELKEQSEETVYLIKNRDKFFKHPCFKDRVTISRELLEEQMTMDLLLQHVKKNCGKRKKILIEFIRKRSAEEFYHKLVHDKTIEETVFCMTGDDSILERKQMIERIKNENGIILVATQVIEAGIDIDMDIGYKDIAKMDSEEQFMGRINRSYTKSRKGIVYFFQMDNPKKIYGEDIRSNKEFRVIEEDMWRFLENKDFSSYYNRILQVWQKNYQRLANKDFYAKIVKELDFPQIKKYMKLIEEDRWNVSVYLGRILEDEKGNIIDGNQIWKQYKELLSNMEIAYAEKKVKLSEITAKMSYFIYQVKQMDCCYDEQIGELFYIENGEEYIEDGKLNRSKIMGQVTEFI